MNRTLGWMMGFFCLALAPACSSSHERPARDPLLAKYDATISAARNADAQARAEGTAFIRGNNTTAPHQWAGRVGDTHTQPAIGMTTTTGAGLTRDGSGTPAGQSDAQTQTQTQTQTGTPNAAEPTSGPGHEIAPKSSLPSTGQGTGNVSGPTPASGAGGHAGGATSGASGTGAGAAGAGGSAGGGSGGGAGGGGAGGR